MPVVDLVNVFTHAGTGGNPCPIVVDASGMSSEDMRAVAAGHGHESGFVVPADAPDCDLALRFFVPRHEMEMCGHATIGALWTLARRGLLAGSVVRIGTRSGPVLGLLDRSDPDGPAVEITQPAGKVVALPAEQEADVLATLGLTRADLLDLPVQNAATSRVKTLIPVRSVERLNALATDMARTEACCGRIGSSGLYPFALADGTRSFEARQFPRSSGYPEDAATGIAATALAFGLLDQRLVDATDAPITVWQGRAMGRLSRMRVRLRFAHGRATGCLLGGAVTRAESAF